MKHAFAHRRFGAALSMLAAATAHILQAAPSWGEEEAPISGPQQYAVQGSSGDVADDPDVADGALRDLARSLNNDPLKMYEWVRNNIHTEFYYGCRRGAYMTMVERAGNDVDQCVLLGALFRAAGISPHYYSGRLTIPRTNQGVNKVGITEWLCTTTDAATIALLFSHKPDSTFSAGGAIALDYMWVKASLPGVGDVRFVPALKPHTLGRKPSFDATSGYTQADALTAAGASTTGSYSPAISVTGLRSYLDQRAAAASDNFRSGAINHTMDAAELAQLRRIVPEILTGATAVATDYPQGLGFDSAAATFDNIPQNYKGRLRVKFGTVDRWIDSPALLGQALHCEFDGNGAAILRQNGVELARDTSGGPSGSMAVQVDYEYPIAYTNNLPRTETWSRTITRQGAVALHYSFGKTLGRLQRFQQKLLAQEAANVALSDRLQLIGLHYAAQEAELGGLGMASINRVYNRTLMLAAIFAQGVNSRPSLDIQVNRVSAPHLTFTGVSAQSNRALSLLDGALEGTAVEQVVGARSFGAPTAIDLATRDAYLLTSSNYDSTVPSLVNYNNTVLGAGSVAMIEAFVKDPVNGPFRRAFVLKNSAVSSNGMTMGAFYLIESTGAVVSAINASFGGIGGGTLANVNVAANTVTAAGKNQNHAGPDALSKDPVDLKTGGFLKHDTDLVVGDGGSPTGLTLARSYDSARRFTDPTGLGRGWTHGYDLRIQTRHPVELDAGNAYLDEAIPVVLAVRAISAMGSTSTFGSDARSWLMASTIATWAVDRQLNSRASVTLGSQTLEFVKRADGAYMAPGNLPASLAQQTDGSYDLAFRHGNTIHFRASDGKFTTVKDQFNNTNTLTATYHGSGLLQTVTDAYSRSFTFNYDGTDRLTGVSDSTGRSVSYGREGSTFTFTDAVGKTQRYEMDGDFCLTRIRDGRDRVVVANDYDSWKRVWQQRTFDDSTRTSVIGVAPGLGMEKDPAGGTVWTYLDARGRVIFTADQNNQVWTNVYDGVDRVVTTITPKGNHHDFGYNAAHVLVSETNEVGHTRTIEPDGSNRPWKIRNFEGKETVVTYTTQHRVETVTGPDGLVSSFDYDSRGRLWHAHPAAYAAGAQDTYTYNGTGGLDRITLPDSLYDDFNVNDRGDLLEVIDRKGVKTTFEYNNRREPTKRKEWNGLTSYSSELKYDDAGDMNQAIDALGRYVDIEHNALGDITGVWAGPAAARVQVRSRGYNSRNLLETSVDALGNTTTVAYHATQMPAAVTDPLNRTTYQFYDEDQRPGITRTPLAFDTSNSWDFRSWLDGVQDAESQAVDFEYDKDGRTLVLANRLNKSFTWTYDDANRTITAKTPLLRTTTVSFNIRGLPSSVQEPSTQATSFDTYDSEGRLTQTTDGVGVTTSDYWPNGLPKHVTEGGRTTYREYDYANRLSRYEDGEGNAITYEYYETGQLKKINYPGSKSVTYDYDDFGRLWHVTDWANRVTTYAYDEASRLIRTDRPNGTYRLQDYDAAGQLRFIKEYKPGGTVITFQELRYDADGRITSNFIHPKPTTLALAQDDLLYDDDNQLSNWNGQTAEFDLDGNMKTGPLPDGSISANNYSYNTRNQLVSAGGSGSRYSPDGHRVEITGAGAATFVVDPASRVLSRTKDGVTTYYVYGLGLLHEEAGGTPRYYHGDQVGSTLALTDASGNVTDRWNYSPFGSIAARTGSTDTPFQFNGTLGVQTDASGLHYMRARYYNSRIMRFINADPIGFGGGTNWYAFCGNDPVSFADPFGLERNSNGTFSSYLWGKTKGEFLDPLFSLITGILDPHGARATGRYPEREESPLAGLRGLDDLPDRIVEHPINNTVQLIPLLLPGAMQAAIERNAARSVGHSLAVARLSGSGPQSGFLEVSSRVRSTAAVRNFASSGETDFIYNFRENKFLMGNHRLGHDGLRGIMGASESDIAGGNIFRNGRGLFTNEMSGHYGEGFWTPQIRAQFQRFLDDYKINATHTPGIDVRGIPAPR